MTHIMTLPYIHQFSMLIIFFVLSQLLEYLVFVNLLNRYSLIWIDCQYFFQQINVVLTNFLHLFSKLPPIAALQACHKYLRSSPLSFHTQLKTIHSLSVRKWCIQAPMCLLSHLFLYDISSRDTYKMVSPHTTLLCSFCSQRLDALRLMETRVSYLFYIK